MAITNQAVLKKMMNELQKAIAQPENTDAVRGHVRAVQTLGDLLLDAEQAHEQQPKTTTISDELELKKMMGTLEQSTPARSVGNTNQLKKSVNPDHGEANGDSIFDF